MKKNILFTALTTCFLAGEILSLNAQTPKNASEKFICSEQYGIVFGNFDSDVPNGRGIQYLPDGSKYYGDFVDGKYSGHGQLHSSSGEIIFGEFKNGKAEGLDTLIYANGMVFIGTMREGKATRKGLKFASAASADVVVPAFPEVKLNGKQKKFLKSIKNTATSLNDRPASYKGGDVHKFFQDYMSPRLKWPKKKEYSSGLVEYEFTVNADGSIGSVLIKKDGGDFSKSVKDVLAKAPKWDPAVSDGKFVPQVIRHSIDFYQEW